MKTPCALILLLAAGCAAPAPASEVVDLSRFLAGLDGTFVLLDRDTGRIVRHDPARAATRFSPCSTFKIPNSLIAVETGVATGSDFVIPWDPRRDPPEPWWDEMKLDWKRDHTLASAFRNSVVWYYRELARRIGEERMARLLAEFRYGNGDTSGGIDRFWLSGGLAISADEQVDFLRRLHGEALGVSPRATAVVKEILVLERDPGFVLSGKTGLGSRPGDETLGWFVGWVETGDDVFFFALNLSGRDGKQVREARVPLARAILRELRVLPGE